MNHGDHKHHMPGHNMNGHDMPEHDMNGHDMNGHNMNGHDMNGHNMNGHDMHGHNMATTTIKPEHHVTNSVPYHVMADDINMTGHHNMAEHVNNHHNHNMHDVNTHLHHHDNTAAAHHSHHHNHHHSMAFHTRNDDYILFSDWQLSPGKVTFFVCFALILVAVLYQAIKMVRAKLGRKCPNTDCKRYILSKGHIMQTVFYMAQFVVGYMLMLAVMTYNAWVMTAAVVGIGLGYFFFGWAEYEEIVRLKPITLKGYNNRTRTVDCGSAGDQELVPLSKDTTATDISHVTNNVACSCGEEDL